MATNKDAVNPMTPEEVVRQLRALREQVPDFVLMTSEELKPFVRSATAGVELVHEAINAIDASPKLAQTLDRSPESLRAEAEIAARWVQVLVEVDAFRLGVSCAITMRRHRVGSVALKTYQVSRQLTRYKENADLLPHIDAMRRALVKFRKRRPQPGPAPEPARQ